MCTRRSGFTLVDPLDKAHSTSSGRARDFRAKASAFTLVELIATIAILALLLATIVPVVGNYVQSAKQTSDRQTLAVLNDALTRYKTQGGSLAALTAGAPIANVLARLQTPVSWAGLTHQFLKEGTTYPARSLDAMGSGATYRFYGYGSYSDIAEGDIADGTVTSDAPYGKGVGYLERDGSSATTITVRTSTDYVAYQVNGGSTSIAAATSTTWDNISVPAGANLRFWSCAGAADSSYSGGVDYINCVSKNLSSLNVSGLTNLTYLNCGSNNLSSFDVSGCVNLINLGCSSNNFSSLDVSGLTSLEILNCAFNNLTGLDVSGLTNLMQLYCGSNNLTSLDIEASLNLTNLDCSSNNLGGLNVDGLINLRNLSCRSNNLSSLDVGSLVNLTELYCGSNNLTSLDLSGLASFTELDCSSNSLTSLNLGGLSNFKVLYCGSNNLTSLDLSGLVNLRELYCSSNNLTSLDVSGENVLFVITYYGNPFASSAATLNAFYSSLKIPGTGGGGNGYLWENDGDPYSAVSVGQDTGLIPAGWMFSDY